MAQITLKKLAELSGLSIRTVSRVLKDQANVIPEKRELVLELARKYHYQPNMAARNLRLQKKSFVGILSSNFQTEVFLQKVTWNGGLSPPDSTRSSDGRTTSPPIFTG